MCGSMADIQSPTAEIRRGKKKEETTGKNIMSASATQGGHKKATNIKNRWKDEIISNQT